MVIDDTTFTIIVPSICATCTAVGYLVKHFQIPRNGSRPITGKEHKEICSTNMKPVLDRLDKGDRNFEKFDEKLDTMLNGQSEMKSEMSFILGTLKRGKGEQGHTRF
jgi:hypothetical protein